MVKRSLEEFEPSVFVVFFAAVAEPLPALPLVRTQVVLALFTDGGWFMLFTAIDAQLALLRGQDALAAFLGALAPGAATAPGRCRFVEGLTGSEGD